VKDGHVKLVIRHVAASSGLVVMLAAGVCGCGPPDAREQALDGAAGLARREVLRIEATAAANFDEPLDPRHSYQAVLQTISSTDRNGPRVRLGSGLGPDSAWFDVTTVETATASNGFSTKSATVRMCARIVARFASDRSGVGTTNLGCPADLPNFVANFGEIDKVVPFEQ
jgi:hypothetical protein